MTASEYLPFAAILWYWIMGVVTYVLTYRAVVQGRAMVREIQLMRELGVPDWAIRLLILAGWPVALWRIQTGSQG